MEIKVIYFDIKIHINYGCLDRLVSNLHKNISDTAIIITCKK